MTEHVGARRKRVVGELTDAIAIVAYGSTVAMLFFDFGLGAWIARRTGDSPFAEATLWMVIGVGILPVLRCIRRLQGRA